MTRMLVVVETGAAAEAAVAAGADGVVLRCGPRPDRAALAAVRGHSPLALLLGDAMADWRGLREVGGDVFVPLAAAPPSAEIPGRRIALLPDVGAIRAGTFDDLATKGFAGAVVGGRARLLAETTTATLQRQADWARARGLILGFGGLIEAPDIPRLLALAPDMLLLDAVAWRGDVADPLAPDRLRVLRDLIPRDEPPPLVVAPLGADRIFVRDWTVPVRIGAYRHERDAQRVRFTVEAEVARPAARADDLRDVVSYDLVTDAIGRATAAHVDLVETLAEDVARAVLAHPRVIAVDIVVEKLDLGPGSVGCRLRRTRERAR